MTLVVHPLSTGRQSSIDGSLRTLVYSYLFLAGLMAMGTVLSLILGAGLPSSGLVGSVALCGSVLGTIFSYLRRRTAELTIVLSPDCLTLKHRAFGLSLHTDAVDLARLASATSEANTLLLTERKGRTIREPMPALPVDAVGWIAQLVEQARSSNATFWREQLARTEDQAALQALVRDSSAHSR